MQPRLVSRLSIFLMLVLLLQICMPITGATAAPLAALGNGVLFEEDFSDNSAGWTMDTEWEIGPAKASSGHDYGNPDPSQDHTPTGDNGVAGVVIGGNASIAALHGFYYLTSPAINTAGSPDTPLTLEYWRWLNSDHDPYMLNRVEVFTDFMCGIVWQSGDADTGWIRDNAWTQMTRDITAFRGANMRVRFGFNIGFTSAIYTVSSWNLDDVRIFEPNAAPAAQSSEQNTDEDTPLNFTLSTADADGGTLTYTIVTPPAHGTLSGTAPDLTYTPDLNYHGPDSFTFKANDGLVDSNTAAVSITVMSVEDVPDADDQSLTTQEDTPLDITLTASDGDGDPLTYTRSVPPVFGVLSGTPPNLTYTPHDNLYGLDSFTFTASDGHFDSYTATVSITVNPVDDPTMALPALVQTQEDTLVEITLAVTDVDGDLLTYTVSDPAHGTLTGTAPDLTYTPEANYNGPDSFTFSVNDGTTESNLADIGIVVVAENDEPTAHDLALDVDEDSSALVTLTGSDIEGQPLTFTIMTQPEHGKLDGTAPDLTYTPDLNYHGPDSFTYLAVDEDKHSTIATVSITVKPVNDAPTAEAIPNQGWGSRLAHQYAVTAFSDIDGDELTYSALLRGGADLPGWLVMDAGGVLSGTPSDADVGSYEIVVTADDGQGGKQQSAFTLTVTPMPYPHYFPWLRHLK